MNSIKTDYGYQCLSCKREYKEKYNCLRHSACCEFLCKTRLEQNKEIDSIEQIPTQKELYKLIQELAYRNEKLEKEVATLKQTQKRKLNILDWLNSNETSRQNITFIEWVNREVLPRIPETLASVYENNLSTGLIDLFERALNSITDLNELPIRAYENKTNVFYVLKKINSANEWVTISNTDLTNILSQIGYQFIVQFKKTWFIPNQERVERDEHYKDLYVNYYQKILGGNEKITEETRNQKVRQYLYSKLKQNIKTIIEYDIF